MVGVPIRNWTYAILCYDKVRHSKGWAERAITITNPPHCVW